MRERERERERERATYIPHRSRIEHLHLRIHDSRATGRSFPGTWPCRPGADRWSPGTGSLCPHSLPGTGNSTPGEIPHTQTAGRGQGIAHVYLLKIQQQK